MLSFDSQTFSWLGRRLMSYAKGGTTTNYTYNSDGVRTKKVSGATTTDYCLNGTQILAEKRGSTLINYLYASDGTRVGFKTGGMVYYYVYNLQGDVTHIVDESRNIAATYRYDPFGKILNLSSLTNIGKLNPFRYRGYYYDTESNLYYLNSRYYNPEIGRFINADAILGANKDILGYNLYAYCGNNPLNRADPTGHAFMLITAAKGRAGEVASGLVKNTKRIHSLTGTASYRIPDGLSDTILSEVKNYSGTLSYTNQLKDFVLYSQSNGLEMHLYTNAHLTGPLQHAVDIGLIQVFPLK